MGMDLSLVAPSVVSNNDHELNSADVSGEPEQPMGAIVMVKNYRNGKVEGMGAKVVNEPSDVHCPVVEMATRSKLSCLSWNKYSKNVIASSDSEGIVAVWDVQTRQSVMEYEEHEKRAWSVDFSRTEPKMLVSGSDGCKVKVWCTNQEASVINIGRYNVSGSIQNYYIRERTEMVLLLLLYLLLQRCREAVVVDEL
ncbi:hypothetical protein ZWY2020_005736 [Hordeum vulgare]|nr:hypothetical protein ZWY2020_005736 [Hordeum vulgare]